MTNQPNYVESAADLAERGLPVVPLHNPEPTPTGRIRCSCAKGEACPSIGKHPRTRHGVKDATTSPTQILASLKLYPNANVGVATGERSGLLVVDEDPRNGGTETLAELERTYGPLPRTVEVITGGGGRHLYFKHPGGGVRLRGKLGKGVDVKGEGGYVVGPGSLHASGAFYRWAEGLDPDSVDIAPLPDWMLSMLTVDTFRQETVPVVPAVPVSANADADTRLGGCVVTARGQYDEKKLTLARYCKFELGLPTAEACRPLFDEWWRRSRSHCAEQNTEVAWEDFRRAFGAARTSTRGGGPAEQAAAWVDAHNPPVPPWAAERFESAGTHKAVLIVAKAHELSGGHPFKLSCHQLGRILGIPPGSARTLLRALEREGVIRCIDRGKPGPPGRNAGVYTYLGEPACTPASRRVDSAGHERAADSA